MPDISGLAALDVLVGLFFLYFLLSIVCSSVQEFIAQILNLRAKTLEDGVRNLVGDEALTERFFRHPRLKALSKPRGGIRRAGRGPSYIPSRVFAVTLMDTLFPEEHGRDTIALARHAVDDENVPARVRTMLRDALDHAGNLVARGMVSQDLFISDRHARALFLLNVTLLADVEFKRFANVQ